MTDKKTFGRLVPECKARGIGRTVAFDLVNRGLLETFTIGKARYVKLDSLDSLPEKLKELNS
jgi:hypothetical protein